MKTIVTHLSPDLDAITSCWLIRRFMPGWDEAGIVFVPQQTLWNEVKPDSDPDILYVDTGFGKFDHHQIKGRLSASKIIYSHLTIEKLIDPGCSAALGRVIEYVNEIDNFAEVTYPDPTSDKYDFCLHQLITGLKKTGLNDLAIVDAVSKLLEGSLELFKNKIRAEKEVEKGYIFQSTFGKCLSMSTANDEALRLAQKMGYQLVMTKDPQKGSVRIKTPPSKDLDLTPVYNKIKEKDTKGYWFLHISKNMLLNGSAMTPNATPTTLTSQQLIEIIRHV